MVVVVVVVEWNCLFSSVFISRRVRREELTIPLYDYNFKLQLQLNKLSNSILQPTEGVARGEGIWYNTSWNEVYIFR